MISPSLRVRMAVLLLLAVSTLLFRPSSGEPGRLPVLEPSRQDLRVIEELRAGGAACALCSDSLEGSILPLRRRQVVERGERVAAQNRQAVARVDSLLKAGYFGPPEEEPSREEAERALKLVLRTAFDYIAELAQDDVMFETNEEELLRPLADGFLNVGVYPVRTLRRARIGRGSYCMEFALEGRAPGSIEQGGGLERLHLEDLEVGSETLPALRVDFGVEGHGEVELLYLPRCCGSVSRFQVVDRGDTLDMVVLRDVEGSYVRKAGVHALGGVALWRGRLPGGRWDPNSARVGAAAYFPRIKFRLPLFLPDLGLEDLRGYDLPQPFWSAADVRDRRLPSWIQLSTDGYLSGWRGEGPRPMILERIFPDL